MTANGHEPTTQTEPAFERAPESGNLGLSIFLASLTMLFGATLIGYILTRLRAPQWPPPGMPHLPAGLVFSTFIIIASSFTAQAALREARSQRPKPLRRALQLTFALGLLFLGSQAANWWQLAPQVRAIGIRPDYSAPARPEQPRPGAPPNIVAPPLVSEVQGKDPTPRQFAFLFYTLTGLHGLHVLGGLVALGLLLLNDRLAYRRPLLQLRRVRHAVVYWHFLDVVWIVMYGVLLI